MNRYRPDATPRRAALLGAIALTSAMLAGVGALAHPPGDRMPVTLIYTGEITPEGPLYRMPTLHVKHPRAFEIVLPALLDRAFERLAAATRKPDA